MSASDDDSSDEYGQEYEHRRRNKQSEIDLLSLEATIKEEVRERNEIRALKGLPEINEAKEVKRIKISEIQGKKVYKRLRPDAEYEDPADYLKRIE